MFVFCFVVKGDCSVSTLLKMRPGANLFKDFQVLSRIWTHPWCLELHYIREKVVNSLIFFSLYPSLVFLDVQTVF